MGWSKEFRVQIREWRRGREVRMPIDEVRRRKWLSYPSGGLAFSYCFGAACREDLAEQGVFGTFCALKKYNKPRRSFFGFGFIKK
jgi:hypothetical protein